MQKPTSKNTILIIIAVVIIGISIYFYTSGSPQDDASFQVESVESTDATQAATRILVLLNQINSIKIDTEFFTSHSYSSLVDHTVPIYEQSVGKSNPFFNPNRRSGSQ